MNVFAKSLAAETGRSCTMLTVTGKHNSAIAYADTLENSAVSQLKALCDQQFTKGANISIMPDAHAGAGCVIGTTMTISDRIVPNLVGVDISCGMETVNIGPARPDFQKLDAVIRESVPTGFENRKKVHRFADSWNIGDLECAKILQKDKTYKSLGTLGGGKHFIELAKEDNSEDYHLIIHSGSRNPGLQVATHYQKIAGKGRPENTPYELAWLSGDAFQSYVHDMQVMQKFADLNRRAIADEIMKGMKWKAMDSFSTLHNYLDTDAMILRKGAVSARKGERLLIPMNMRDGSLLCEGLGNPEWNFSAPHGAGRLFSRSDARNSITLTRFKNDMQGIYSTCVSRKTIDESPAAYKPMEKILEQIGPTVKVLSRLRPVYNFKAAGE